MQKAAKIKKKAVRRTVGLARVAVARPVWWQGALLEHF